MLLPAVAPGEANPIQSTDSFATLARLALIGATAASTMQLAAHFAGRYALGHTWSWNPRMIVLAPLANLAVFLPVLALIWLAVRSMNGGRLPDQPARTLAILFGVMAGLSVVSPLLLLRPKLHGVAIAVLAMGVGVVAFRVCVAREGIVRRALPAATVLALLIPLGGEATIRLMERSRREGALASAQPDEPNVILLVLDTVRALSMSAYGYSRPTTPRLAQLASEGVRFERATSTAPWTLASHATLFTGAYPPETGVSWTTPLDGKLPVLAERFAARGYQTGGFVANLTYCTPSFGLDRGFHFYQDYVVTAGEALHASMLTRFLDEAWHHWKGDEPNHGRPTAREVADGFLAWERRASVSGAGHPYFAFLNFFDAHAPYDPPAPYDTMFIGRQATFRDPRQLEGNDDAKGPRELQSAYDQSLAYLDAELGRLLDSLRVRGRLDNTLVVVVADHGEQFMENGTLEHGDDLFFPSLHVPLIVRYPTRVPAGTVVKEPVSLRDVAATILDVARGASTLAGGAASTPRDALPGSSLERFWTPSVGGAIAQSPLLSNVPFAPNLPPSRPVSKGPMRSLVRNGLHLIVRGDGFESLYDVVNDPFEQRDVIADPANAPTLQALRSELQVGEPRTPER